jgi:hypothetical protein
MSDMGKRWNAGSQAQRIMWLSEAGVHASLVNIFVEKNWAKLSRPVQDRLERWSRRTP